MNKTSIKVFRFAIKPMFDRSVSKACTRNLRYPESQGISWPRS